jgi:hypothetical protein
VATLTKRTRESGVGELRHNRKCLVLISVGMSLFLTACRDRHSQWAIDNFRKIRKRVDAEIASNPNHPWAGEYQCGGWENMMATYLTIAPQSGFVFARWCPDCYDRNYGTVREDAKRIRLSCAFENKKKVVHDLVFEGIADELIPVVWGPRHYLIGADEMITFLNSVNSGWEGRYLGKRRVENGWEPRFAETKFLLRRGDEKKRVTGLPAIPVEYKKYLLKEPVTAEIIVVGGSQRDDLYRSIDTAVTIDAGQRNGLLPGMELYPIAPDNVLGYRLRLTKISEKTADGKLTQYDHLPTPQRGCKLSTRLPPECSMRGP